MSQCRNCGNELIWDETKVSKNGKMIPLETDGTPHKCINNPYNKKKKHTYLGISFDEDNGFTTIGNFIIPTDKVDEYVSLLTKGSKRIII